MATPVPNSQAPTIHLAAKDIFDGLDDREKLYAHHMSLASWYLSRIILRQTSPEAESIFDLIVSLYHHCDGESGMLLERADISRAELDKFLSYAALFLCNLGNFYGEGGQKFVPDLTEGALKRIIRLVRPETNPSWMNDITKAMVSLPPDGLGFPTENAISNYYLGERISREEISDVTKTMKKHGIEPENTRIRKNVTGGRVSFDVLQASVESEKAVLDKKEGHPEIRLVRGDHSIELERICFHLNKANSYTVNDTQKICLSLYMESFQTGNLRQFREAQKAWVADKAPSVESMLGFIEPGRDPYGVRSEWQGVVCIADAAETRKMREFVHKAPTFATLLPWATAENNGKGPFEKTHLDLPHFTIQHALTFCASSVWEAANLPNYNDIRENVGSKNLFVNRMFANSSSPGATEYLRLGDAEVYKKNLHIIRFVATAIHEVLGHGTGKLLSETEPGKFNFDPENPPLSPHTGRPVQSWYRHGQTWTGVFEDLAVTVEECRAILISAYLIDNRDLLHTFGYNEDSDPTEDGLIYLSYLHLGVEGIRSLEHYNKHERTWTEAHNQAYSAIFKYLPLEGERLLTVQFDPLTSGLSVHLDCTKISSHGKVALGQLLCRLHVWRCTADVKPCRDYYGQLTAVEGRYEAWREFVSDRPQPRWKFVQANTFVPSEGKVEIKVYEESNEGIVQSWAERDTKPPPI